MIRISSILTDAPLLVAEPINESKCGDCNLCTGTCPAGAVSGKLWHVGCKREDFFDAVACRKTARERAMKGFGIEITQCGKCIEACPYTRRYLEDVFDHIPDDILQIDIRLITDNKKDFLPLLLLGDESETMVDTYLYRRKTATR